MAIDPNTQTAISRLLTTGEAISRFTMNSLVNSSPELIREQTRAGVIDPDRLAEPPEGILRTASLSFTGSTPLGPNANTSKEFTINPVLPKFVPNRQHTGFSNIEEAGRDFSGSVELVEGVPLGTFLNTGDGSSANPNNLPISQRDKILKNLYVQSEILKAARSRPEFRTNRIAVEEGLYDYDAIETSTEGDLADLSSVGRAIAYVCKTIRGGTTDVNQTFKLAEYFASLPFYDKIILDYYNFVPGALDTLGMRVFVVLPEIDDNFDANWNRRKETRFNGRKQSDSLLLLGTQDPTPSGSVTTAPGTEETEIQ